MLADDVLRDNKHIGAKDLPSLESALVFRKMSTVKVTVVTPAQERCSSVDVPRCHACAWNWRAPVGRPRALQQKAAAGASGCSKERALETAHHVPTSYQSPFHHWLTSQRHCAGSQQTQCD